MTLRTLLRCFLLALLLACPWRPVWAQADLPTDWQEMLERWNETADSPVSIDEVEELFELFAAQPIDINDTVGEGLQQLFFVSPFQCAALRAYIGQYGALLSMDELSLVPGFDEATVALLRPVVQLSAPPVPTALSWRDLWRKGRHHLLMGANGTVERARGYREEKYEGSPYRLYWRYRYRAGRHVQLQLSGDKDAGEALFAGSQTQGFDHYGFHLMVNEMGWLRRLVVGDFNLQFGQGATLWSGFAPYTTLGMPGYRSARGIVPASAFVEHGYLTGVAATVAPAEPWEVTLFYAYTPLDATVPSKLEGELRDGLPLVQSIYLSGYHRTATEIAKRHQLDEQLYGAHITYRNTHLRVGLTGYRMELNKYVQPHAYRYNYYYFSGHENTNLGLDAAYRHGNLLAFGEVAMSQNQRLAALAGLDYLYGASNRLGVAVHHYDAWYWNLHADALSMGGYTRNEEGATLTAVTALPARFRAESALSWCRYPEMRSTAYGASQAWDFRTRLSRPLGQALSAALLYRYKRQEANVKRGGQYLLFPARRHQCQLDLHYDATAWHYGLRLAWVGYRLDEERAQGLLLHGDVRWAPATLPLSLSLRLSLFDVDDYDARIYAVENGVAFDNSGTFFNHRGVRAYAVVHYDINRWFTLAFKYSVSQYLDDSLFGSDYEALETSHRQQWRVQLRLKL